MSVDLRSVSRYRSGKGYRKISEALKVPVSTAASIICKWKKSGTTSFYPPNLSDRGRRALVREVTKNPTVILTELKRVSVERGELSRRTSVSAALHQLGLCGRVARRKLLSKRHTTALSDETKIKVFGLNGKRHIWRKRAPLITWPVPSHQ